MIALLLACGGEPPRRSHPVAATPASPPTPPEPALTVTRMRAGNVWKLRGVGLAPGAIVAVIGGGETRGVALDPAGEALVFGLVPDADHVATAGGASASFRTGHPDPARCPRIDVLANDPARRAPGWLLVPFSVRIGRDACVQLLDEALRPRWWWLPEPGDLVVEDVIVGPDGRLWLREEWIEVRDWAGGLHARYVAEPAGPLDRPLPTGICHHELVPEPDGSFWTFGRTSTAGLVPVADGAEQVEVREINENPVFHVSADGVVRERIDLVPLVQPGRAGFDGLNLRFPAFGVDYLHANALEVLADGGVVVSLRNQDLVMRLDPDGAGGRAVTWRFGDPAGWDPPWSEEFLAPEGRPAWSYHQHGVDYDPATGDLLVFDNHPDGGSPYHAVPGDDASRARRYRVDEDAGTVALLASFEDSATGPLRASIMGDADLLPGDHLLAAFAWLEEEGGVPNAEVGRGDVHSRVVEFVPGGPPALDLRLWLDRAADPQGGYAYRVERLDPPF